MQWAFRRQFLYAFSVFLFFAVLGALGWYFFIYTPPSCTDGVMNQDEEGVDCGGVCVSLCTAPRVSSLWARSVRVAPGVYHAVAMVRNPETDSGTKGLPYTFSLFDDENILVAERRGVMYIDPGEIAPLLVTNIITGERVPTRTFVAFGDGAWQNMENTESPLRLVSQELEENALRLSVVVENTSALPVDDITLTALLYDESDLLIAASQTTVKELSARSSHQAVFTWQEPFSKPVFRADVIPRYPEHALIEN